MSYVETLRESYREIRTRLRTPVEIKPSRRPKARPFAPTWSLPAPPPKPQYVKPSIVVFNKNSLAIIVEEVAAKHGLTVHDLRCVCRAIKLVNARHEFFYRAATETTVAYAAIGRFLNDRDHTTVIHGIRRHCKRNGLSLPRGMPSGEKA